MTQLHLMLNSCYDLTERSEVYSLLIFLCLTKEATLTSPPCEVITGTFYSTYPKGVESVITLQGVMLE